MQDMDMITEELKAKFLAGECTEEETLHKIKKKFSGWKR